MLGRASPLKVSKHPYLFTGVDILGYLNFCVLSILEIYEPPEATGAADCLVVNTAVSFKGSFLATGC